MYDNERVISIVSKVGVYLRDPISINTLKTKIVGLESLRMELLEVRVDWQQLLAEKKNQMLYPKDKDKTELDRRVMLNASIANIERDCEFLVGLEKLVEQRLELERELLK